MALTQFLPGPASSQAGFALLVHARVSPVWVVGFAVLAASILAG